MGRTLVRVIAETPGVRLVAAIDPLPLVEEAG